jgi:hypothetical protein
VVDNKRCGRFQTMWSISDGLRSCLRMDETGSARRQSRVHSLGVSLSGPLLGSLCTAGLLLHLLHPKPGKGLLDVLRERLQRSAVKRGQYQTCQSDNRRLQQMLQGSHAGEYENPPHIAPGKDNLGGPSNTTSITLETKHPLL